MTKHSKQPWLIGAASAALAMAAFAPAHAQDAAQPEAQNSEDIVVLGRIQYRDRSDAVAPTLEYGADYFQRFEPLTVGDALKRVPSVAFLSDVLESDGVRLRGLDPAYTQILINGEQVPGSGDSSGAFGNGADGAFFVDRIPAELIDRVEIVRSQSANRSGDAVAGALNIVLRDAYSLEGGYIRGGLLNFSNDGHWGEVLGGVWGGEVAGGRLLVGLNMQDRHNPKDKLSLRYDDPTDATINNSEIQTDVRDGTDYSGNFSYTREIGPGELSLSGFFVQTDRYQNEDSVEYDNGVVADANIETVNNNDVDIDQQSYSLSAGYQLPMLGGETRARVSFARFENDAFEFEDEVSYDDFLANDIDEFESEIGQSNLTDDEFKFRLDHEREIGALNLQFGVHYESKERDNLVQSADDDLGGPVFPTPLPANGSLVDPADLSPVDGGDNTIERTRIDPYVMIGGEAGAFQWEAGLRYETTEVTITDRTVGGPAVENSYETLLPSAHFKWSLTDDDRILASVARTVRNPSFNFLSPALLETELEDNDFLGNPDLDPETAWGFDLGYERRLGRTGVAGINFFYRDVTDLIEVVNTTAEGSEGPGTFIYTAENAGDGTVWGVEFDFSAPLTIVGLENTGVFLNYSWLDSEVEDFLGERRFNSQAESIFNVGFIHDMPSLGASFGATYRSQGDAFSRIVSEEVTTSYGADLEMFVEKRFGERFTLRLTGSNLLDESKDEIFDKFVTEADQIARAYDEYELETESAGPVFQLIGRYAF
jgi:outer membrane receptor protein involved in Fe transport